MRTGLALLVALAIAGCDVINYDRTFDPTMAALVGHSFVVNKDSFLIENYCLDEYTTNSCLFMQIAGGYIEVGRGIGNPRVSLPKSFADYEKNKDIYNENLRDDNIFHHTKHEIVAEVPKGTIIKITRLVSVAEGDEGRAWVVFGQLDNQGAEVSIQIGAAHISQSGPWWFERKGMDNYSRPPHPLPEFLSPVDN